VISLRADRRDVAAGARAMVPWLAGLVPFGLVIGVSAAQADIPALAGWLTGPLIYAGSSQAATIGMLDAGAAPMVVVASALIINIRLIFYSATMARYWRDTPWWWRLVAAYLIVDPSCAVGLNGYRRLSRRRAHAHYLGGAVLLWVSWLAAIGVGATAGAGLPAALHLEFVMPLPRRSGNPQARPSGAAPGDRGRGRRSAAGPHGAAAAWRSPGHRGRRDRRSHRPAG